MQSELVYNDSSHQYFVNGTELPSVTTILGGGGGGSLAGSIFHDAMASYFKYKSTDGFKEINPRDKQIIVNLGKFIKEHNLKYKFAEHQVFGEFGGCKYAGTLDLVLQDQDNNYIIVDYKTGESKDNKHHLQLGGYAPLVNAKKAFVFYKDEIVEVDLQTKTAQFERILLAYNNILEGYIWHNGKVYCNNEQLKQLTCELKELLTAEKQIAKQKEELENQIYALKETIKPLLKNESYFDNGIMISKSKDSEVFTLKNDIEKELITKNLEYFDHKLKTTEKNKLIKLHPLWFDKKIKQGSYSFRLNDK